MAIILAASLWPFLKSRAACRFKADGKTFNFTNGPQYMYFKQVNGSVITFYSSKLHEEISGSKTIWRAYVDDIAVISRTKSESTTVRIHKERLSNQAYKFGQILRGMQQHSP